MAKLDQNSLIDELRQVIKDGVDYLQAALALLQARMAEYALTGVVFAALIASALLLGVAAFIFYNIALGMWLSKVFGSGLCAISVLGSFYALLALIAVFIALRWLNTLKS